MQITLALAAFAALAYAQGPGGSVTDDISPEGAAPEGFEETYPSKFQISAVNTTLISKRGVDLSKRADCPTDGSALVISLDDGVLTDDEGRTGYIAANYQFQFDGPPQAGALYTDGFSVGANMSLALGPSAVFYQCLSGGFYNLYDRMWAPQCNPVIIMVIPCGDGAPAPSSGGAVTQISDGQPQQTTAVTQISDGQPQQPTMMVTQIGDGQIQMPTGIVTQIGDGQPQAPTSAATPITQISDGQPQAPTSVATPITQISDGQPQAPTSVATPITQISDGQPQAPTSVATPITQIGDGQPQAPTSAATPITQIGDGQPQAPTSAITQISDGQPQVPSATIAAAQETTGSATPTPTDSAGNNLVAASSFLTLMGSLFALLL